MWAIRCWVKRADRDKDGGDGGLTSAEREELTRLKHENRQLRQEREILSKAAAWFCTGKHRDTEAIFGFVMANQAAYSVQMMCRLLGVSTSGFYAWNERPMSDRAKTDLMLTEKIHSIHRRSNGAYGSPMIHAELSDDHDIHVGRKRVARLMRAAHLQGVWPHRFVITTVRDAAEKPAIDLVDRGFLC